MFASLVTMVLNSRSACDPSPHLTVGVFLCVLLRFNSMTKSNARVQFADVVLFPARPDANSNEPALRGNMELTEAQRDLLIEELTNLEFITQDDNQPATGKLTIALWKRFSTLDGSFNRMVGSVEHSLTEAERTAYRARKQQAPATTNDQEIPY